MLEAILGRKLGMTQIFTASGRAEGVTLIEAGPCKVVQIKTEERDGYRAVQLGFGKAKKLSRPQKGHLKDTGDFHTLREIRLDTDVEVNAGDQVDAGLFAEGDRVDITGFSKGRGFAGVVKRHGFAGGPKTHGQSDRHRAPGSVGSGTTPGRVLKGKKMAGRMGVRRITVRNLEVARANTDSNLLMIKGAVPGMVQGLVIIRKAARSK